MVDTDIQHLLATGGVKLQLSLYFMCYFNLQVLFFHCSGFTSKPVIQNLTDGTKRALMDTFTRERSTQIPVNCHSNFYLLNWKKE